MNVRSNERPPSDQLLTDIAEYTLNFTVDSEEAYSTAYYCLLDSIACALQSLQYPACTKLLGPIVDGANIDKGARIPGTDFELEPIHAAFNLGSMIRWLDYNDTWLAAEWGHPSDNLGGLLTLCDFLNRTTNNNITLKHLLEATIKAYEIQGVLALDNAFNRVGLDHVILVRIASCAVACSLLGCDKTQTMNAISNAWVDGGALRTYRHAPNTGSRKSWAAGDASSRGVWHAFMAKKGEMGYPSALSAPQWGFEDVLFKGNSVTLTQSLGSYVMENILFKISFPAEFHAQTAVEAALTLHPGIMDKLHNIERIEIQTQEPGVRIIDKTGPLNNPADRDHCLQYMVAIPLIFGRLSAEDYEDKIAADPRIDNLRDKMIVSENKQYSVDYLDPSKRSIPNSVQVFFNDGSSTNKIEVHYPLGHRHRRQEAIPQLLNKFTQSLMTKFDGSTCQNIIDNLHPDKVSSDMPINRWIDYFIPMPDKRNETT